MTAFRTGSPRQDQTDERLMRDLAAGRQEALGPLYSRYARLVFNLANHTLDRAAAEEVVQDVFLTIWRKASAFDPLRGAFRPWMLQIAHYRILNELRHRGRRPQVADDPEGLHLASLADHEPGPDEVAWRESVRSAVRSAFAELPSAQREAIELAFFENRTHEQVAEELRLPLGTAKTRIRTGLQKLRGKLAPLTAGLVVAALLGAAGVGYRSEQMARERDERALALVTTSETEAIRLTATPSAPPAAHGQYRGRPGVPMAVLTVSHLAPAPAGRQYRAWVRHDGAWTSLGVLHLDAQGEGRLIAEGSALAAPPTIVEVTLEPEGGAPAGPGGTGGAPSGPIVIVWP
ncbi:MAG TPA: sigma-70 family RNA polymerase sigma factor [bacterium]|nr:sigma-70 family RNA polymerase sigma factor [bacterium]